MYINLSILIHVHIFLFFRIQDKTFVFTPQSFDRSMNYTDTGIIYYLNYRNLTKRYIPGGKNRIFYHNKKNVYLLSVEQILSS